MENQTNCSPNANEGITFRDLGKFLKKALPLMIVGLIICCLIAAAVGLIFTVTTNKKDTAYGTISLTYAGIEDGKDPSGAYYDMQEIRSTQYVAKALSNLGLSYDVAEVRSAISIQGVVPESYQENIDKLLESGELTAEQVAQLEYMPTSFNVALDVSLVENMNKQEAVGIVNELMTVYLKDFYLKHTEHSNSTFALISSEDIKASDFASSITSISSQINSLSSYLATMAKQYPSFVSSDDTTFSMLKESARLAQEDFNTLIANVKNNGIAKDKVATKNYLEYKVASIDGDLAAKQTTLTSITGFLQKYADQYPDITVGGTGNPSVTVPQSKVFDDMFKQQQILAEEIEALTIEKEQYSYWISKLGDVSVPTAAATITDTENKLIEKTDSLGKLIENTNATISEFKKNDVLTNATISGKAVMIRTNESFPWLKSIIIAAVIGILVGMIVSPILANYKHKKALAKSAALSDTPEIASAEDCESTSNNADEN